MSSPQFDDAVSHVDRVTDALRRGVITRTEFATGLETAAQSALGDQADPFDDIALLIQYILDAAETVLRHPVDGDRARFDQLVRRLALAIDRPVIEARFELMLAEIRERLDDDTVAGVERLVDLCATGGSDHADVFVVGGLGLEVIELATAAKVPDALLAAVTPRGVGWGQLGHYRRDDGRARRAAFDGLAALAAEGFAPGARRAVDHLISLTEFPTTAIDAAIRLPVHLLDRDQRQQLHTTLDHHVEWIDAYPSSVLFDVDTLRVPHTLRSVLWLASDAAETVEREAG